MKNDKNIRDAGFSLIELLIVFSIILVMVAVTGFYLSAHQKLYKPDDQSVQIVDILQEARQRSLTQRETMRVEIDLTDNIIRLIDENTSATASDDRIVRQISLFSPTDVRIDQRPDDITVNPPEQLPVPSAVFKPSIYPPSATHRVCTLRFLSNGTVADAGTNPIGGGAVTTGATLHVWSPNGTNPNVSDIARAITIIGTTGSIQLWEYNRNSTDANKWKDSRRTGVFGGTTSH